jgi:hypothetical protein
LLAAIRVDHHRDEAEYRLLEEVTDWDVIHQAARRHNLLPLLYQYLKTCPAGLVPAAQLNRFQELFYTNALRNERLAQQLLWIIDLLANNAITAIPIKGPALALQAYRDLSLRNFYDLDLLIHPRDFWTGYQVLTAIGYQPPFELSRKQAAWLVRTDYDLPFKSKSGVLELHWRMAERAIVYPLPEDFFWQNLQSADLLDRQLQLLSPAVNLLALCVHGAKHEWQSLRWVTDIACLIRAEPGLDWDSLHRLATKAGFTKILQLGIDLAVTLGGVPIPPGFLPETDDPLFLHSLQVLSGSAPQPGIFSSAAFYLRTRERWRERLFYLADQAFVPKQDDWKIVSLPEWLYPVYFLLRPLRLVNKLIRYLLRRKNKYIMNRT